MKRIEKYVYVRLPPSKLYMDDLEKIYAEILDVCREVQVCSDNYELETSEAYRNLPLSKIETLEFRGKDPYIVFEVGAKSASFFAAKDNVESRGLMTIVKDIIEKRKRPFAWTWSSNGMFALAIGMGLTNGLMFFGLAQFVFDNAVKRSGTSVWGITVWALILFLTVIQIFLLVRSYTIRYTEIVPNANGSQGFVVRNRDQMIIGFVFFLAGVLATVVFALVGK